MPNILERSVYQESIPELGELPPLLRRLYLARGVRSMTDLDLGLGRLLQPDGLSGVTTAVNLLATAINQGKKITVVGDYDVDGATASALSILVLQALGAQRVNFFIPDRFTMGYGLAPELVDQAANSGTELLLTVDAGITSIAGVARARDLGLQVVVTDHHLPGDKLPAADAIVNPNLPGDQFPGKFTAGVGVVFYLLAVLRQRLQPTLNMTAFLDLVALGTVADMVPLDQNNRILVEYGLRLIRAGRCRPGIAALLKIAKRPLEKVVAEDLAFHVGPRLKAAGRLKTMDIGLSCLLCADRERALQQAEILDGVNRERRSIESQMQEQAIVILEKLDLTGKLPLGLCLYDDQWHQGIIGLLASKIRERYQRPVIVLSPGENGTVKGSARSIPEVHMRDLLTDIERRYPNTMIRYGGHPMAAGLTMYRDKVEFFKLAFDEAVNLWLQGQLPRAQILTDGTLDPTCFNTETARMLRYAGPWGQGFPPPVFTGEFKVLSQRHVGTTHLKLVLETTDVANIDAIIFNWGTHSLDSKQIRIVYRLDLNEYQGRENIQLLIEHLESA